MVQLSGAGKRFGPKLLFENLNWLITPPRRLRDRGAGGNGFGRPRFPPFRLASAHRRILRRLADAHRARQAPARETKSAAARRADQSPGPGSAQLARAISCRISVCV